MSKQAGSWIAPLGVGVVVLVILVVVAVSASQDDVPVSQEPNEGPSSSASSQTASTQPTSTPTSAATSPSAPAGVDLAGPAKKAMKDGFPAFVPAEMPPGWTTTAASYTPGGAQGPLWQLAFQLPDGGSVELTQSELGLRQAVTRYLGSDADNTGKVDLRKFGTGYWFVYTAGDITGLGKQLPSTSVVISAPTQDDAVTLARLLLTAEDAVLPEAG